MPEIGGSLTANAILSRRIFLDNFDRYVSQGLGGTWHWTPDDSGSAAYGSQNSDEALAYVDGAAAVLASPDGTHSIYESYVGFPLPATGDLTFSFWTGSTPWDTSRPTYFFALDGWDWYGVAVSPSGPTEWSLENWTPSDSGFAFSPDPNTWYRVHHRWTADRLLTRVWRLIDPEPDTWDLDNPNEYDPQGWYPWFSFDYSFATADLAKVSNIEIYSNEPTWTMYQAFGAGAELVPGPHLYADAILHRTMGDGTTAIPAYGSIATSAPSSPAASITIAKPSGTASGDTLIAFISYDGQGHWPPDEATPTIAGWRAIDLVRSPGQDNQAIDHSMRIWARTADGSEPSDYTFDLPTSVPSGKEAVGAIVRVTNPVGEILLWKAENYWNSTTHTVPSYGAPPYDLPDIYVPQSGLLIWAAGGSSGGTLSWVPPDGMTERADIKSAIYTGLEIATEDLRDAFIGKRVGTSSFSVLDVVGLLLVMPPGKFFSAAAEKVARTFSMAARIIGSPPWNWEYEVPASAVRKRTFSETKTIGAVKRAGRERTFSMGAYLGGLTRTTHDRGTPPHYDNDFDTIITLAKALDVYQQGTDLHTVLSALVERVAALEGTTDYIPTGGPRFGSLSAASIIGRYGLTSTATLNALLVWHQLGSLSADAHFRRIWSKSATADSVLLGEQLRSLSAAAIARRGQSSSLIAEALLSAIRIGAFDTEAWLLREQLAVFSAAAWLFSEPGTKTNDLWADAILQRISSASQTVDAIVRRGQASSMTGDAALMREALASLAADGVLLREWLSGASASAVLLRAQTGSKSADALLRRTQTPSITSDALLRRTISSSMSVDAIRLKTIDIEPSAGVSLDAWFVRSFFGDLYADAVLFKTQAASLSASATMLGERTATLTADALLRATRSSSAAFDAIKLKNTTSGTEVLRPISDAGKSSGSFTYSSGSTGWNLVDEASLDTADYYQIGVANPANWISHNFTPSNLPNDATIISVAFTVDATAGAPTQTGHVQIRNPDTGTRYNILGIAQSFSPSTQTVTQTTRPWDSAAWTPADLRRLQAGADGASPNFSTIRIRQLYATVTWRGPWYLTANAITKRFDQPGSLTANATIMPIFTANAIQFRAQSGSFGANAVISYTDLAFQQDAFQLDTFQTPFHFSLSAVIVS